VLSRRRWLGFAGAEPRMPLPVKLTLSKDKAALAMQLRRWAELPSLTRILVSRGSAIDDNTSGTLHEQAAARGECWLLQLGAANRAARAQDRGQRSTFGPAK